MLEAEDYKISLVLVPQSHDYSDGEIVYRIFVDDQLISERSLPVLSANEALLDTFVVKLSKDTHNIFVEELGDKKIRCEKIIINNIEFLPRGFKTKDFAISVVIRKRNK